MLSNFFKEFFSVKYMFAEPVGLPSHNDQVIYFAGLALIVIAVVLYILRRFQRRGLQQGLLVRWTRLAFYIGVLLAAWFWLRYELIHFFGLHFVAALIVLGGLVWLGLILKFQFGEYRRLRAEYARQQLKQKYL